jgi:acyl dehydratase
VIADDLRLPADFDAITTGDEFGPVISDVPFKRVILNAAVTWDYFPGHHDPAYARMQGEREIFVNTMFLQGLVDRVSSLWLGHESFLLRRTLQMRRSIVAGDVMAVRGEESSTETVGELGVATLDVTIATERTGDCCSSEVTRWVPRRGQRYVDHADAIEGLAERVWA